MRKVFPLYIIPFLLFACEKPESGSGNEGGGESGYVTTWRSLEGGEASLNSHAGAVSRSNITLIGGTYVQIPGEQLMMLSEDTGVVYPRFVKTGAGDYLMFYHYGNKSTWAGNYCSYARSSDLVNWKFEGKLFKTQPGQSSREADGKPFTRVFAGADLCTLPDGRIMVVASFRGADFRHRIKDNGLAIRFSSDNGKTWTEDKLVYVGTNWEPKPLVLPDGTIQIYYTDSRPFIENIWKRSVVSSGSSYIWSEDGGRSWKPSNPEVNHVTAFKERRIAARDTVVYTDQMPAVICLNGTTRLAAAMEADRGQERGDSLYSDMYVSLAWSGDNYDWGTPDANGRIPSDRADWYTKGAAPYLAQFLSGETVLTYNASNIFYYRIGNEGARNFGAQQRVFPGDSPTGRGFWGSVYITGPQTMVAGVGGTSTVKMMQVGQFWLNHDIEARQMSVKTDGSASEWKHKEALLCGSSSDSHVILRAAKDAQKLHLLVEVEGTGAYAKVELGVGGSLKSTVLQSYGLNSSDFRGAEAQSISGTTRDGVNGFTSELSIPLSEFGSQKTVPVKLSLLLPGGKVESFNLTSQAVESLPQIKL